MKKYLFLTGFFLAFFLVTGFQCEKEGPTSCKDNLLITAIQVDANPTVATGISFRTDVTGANLCYSFDRFSIGKYPGNIIDISAMGFVPCGNAICAQAIYTASPTGRITELSAGTYTLRFYNPSGLFQTVNVTVN
jgi:hypothetical protein